MFNHANGTRGECMCIYLELKKRERRREEEKKAQAQYFGNILSKNTLNSLLRAQNSSGFSQLCVIYIWVYN